jgi:hypothetical protein
VSRRPHLSRTSIGVLLAIAIWLALAAVATRLLSRPAVRSWAAARLSQQLQAAVGQRVRIGDVRLSLVPPRLTVLDVAVGPAGEPWIAIRSCEVAPGQLRIADREIVLNQLRVAGVAIHAALPEGGQKSDSEPWVRVIVRQLEVRDVTIERLELPSGIVVRAAGVEASWHGSRRRPVSGAVAHIGSFTLEVPGLDPVSGSISAWGRLTPTGWEVGRLRGSGPGWGLDLRGSGTNAGALRATGRVSGDLAVVDRTVGIRAGLVGEVSTDVEFETSRGSFSVDARVQLAHFEVAGFSLDDVSGEVHLTDEGLEGALAGAKVSGGTLEGSYTLAGFGPPWSHRVALRGEGVEIGGFLAQLGVDPAGLSAASTINAELAWDGERIRDGSGTAIVDLQERPGDVPVAGRVVIALERDGALHFSSSGALLAGAPIDWGGTLSLGSWIPNWTVRGEQVPVGTVARLLRGWVGTEVLPPELRGALVTDLRLRGPFQDLTVVGDVAVAPVAFGPVDADGLEASFKVERGVLTVDEGLFAVGDGTIRFDGELDFSAGNAMRIALGGTNVPLARLVAWGGVHAPLAGRADFTGSVAGTIDAPTAEATLAFKRVVVAGVPFGDGTGAVALGNGIVRVDGLRVGPFSSELLIDLDRREAMVEADLRGFGLEGVSEPLARLVGGALDCSLRGAFPFDAPQGRLELSSPSGVSGAVIVEPGGIDVDVRRPGVWSVAGEVERSRGAWSGRFEFAVESLSAALGASAPGPLLVDGAVTGRADLSVAGGGVPRLDGELRRLDLELQGERVALRRPARFEIQGGAVTLPGVDLAGPRSKLFVRGSRKADGALGGNVSGEFPAALLSVVWPEASPQGRVQLIGEVSGSDQAPRFEGVAQIADGTLRVPGVPGTLTAVSGFIELVPEAIRLRDVSFALSGGTGTCVGQVLVSPQIELDLSVEADAIRWPLSTGFAPFVSGTIRVSGPLDALSVSGRTSVVRADYRQALSIQSLVLQQLRAPERAVVSEEEAVRLNVEVAVPSTLDINTELLKLVGRGALRIVGDTNRLGLLGRIEAAPGGELQFSGNRYEIDRAVVTFSQAERIEPFLDVVARGTIQTYEVTLSLGGTLDRLSTTFRSIPPLPEMDVLALIAGGSPNKGQSEPLGTLASDLVAGAITGVVAKRGRALLDVDELRIDPSAKTLSDSPTTRVTVVKQLSPNVMVTVSTNLEQNREEGFILRWRLSPTVYLEGRRDPDSTYAGEIKWYRRY